MLLIDEPSSSMVTRPRKPEAALDDYAKVRDDGAVIAPEFAARLVDA
jgi:hypothetical protein